VQVGFVPATNMGTMKTMTSGDEAGAMGGLANSMIKAPGKTTMGNPIVLVTGLPAESLGQPTSGNMMNAPIGAQIVPSVVNVLYTYARRSLADAIAAPTPVSVAPCEVALCEADLRELRDVSQGEGAHVVSQWLAPGIAHLRIGLFSAHTDREVFNAIRELGRDAITGLVLDLRDNPGGDTRAALRLAAAWLPRGSVLLLERDADGDDEAIIARSEPSYPWPLCLLIDGASASAAELLAATLQHHGRAHVIGRPSYGKATGQSAVRWPDGKLRYTTVARYLLPDGGAIDGCGVTPDETIALSSEHDARVDDLCIAAALSTLTSD
jgi:carboxyl-terminal processing protease